MCRCVPGGAMALTSLLSVTCHGALLQGDDIFLCLGDEPVQFTADDALAALVSFVIDIKP